MSFFKSRFSVKQFRLFDLLLLTVLVAAGVVLDRFLSINAWNVKIGFGFMPVAVAAYLYGCIGSMVTAVLADFIGALLFPIGPYFPGFTLTAAVTGFIFGIFLYKNCKILNVIAAALITGVICTLMLNTLWICILYSSQFVPVLITRLFQFVIISIAQIIALQFLYVVDLPLKAIGKCKKSRYL